MEVSWDGPDSKDRAACPYPVDFQCRPAPTESLNSLEAGRLLLQVDFGKEITSVSAKLVNNAKRENLEKAGNSDKLEKTSLYKSGAGQPAARKVGRRDFHSIQLDRRRHEDIREDGRCEPKERREPLHPRDNLYA